jgi:putative peptidoglycan lipid II flippase
MLISVSICIPIVLTCFFAAEPIVKLVFNYGSCTQKDILSIVSLLKIYSFEILAFFLIRTIAIVFFAKKETRITTIGACIHTSLNIVLSIMFLKYNAQGIAYASVISSWVHLSWLSINIIKAKYI